MHKFNYLLALFLSIIFISCQPADTQSQDKNTEVAASQGNIAKSLNVDDWYAMYLDNPGVIIDVRTAGEYDQGYIEGAEMIDVTSGDFVTKLNALAIPLDSPVYLYCRSGNRSKKAMKILEDNGYSQIYELNNGFLGWQGAGKKVVKP